MLKKLFDIERLIHSVKTAIACIFGFFLTKIVGFPADQWIVITIVVVMCAQIYVGSVVQKAYLRFLGTLIGCLFAALAIVMFGDTYPVIAITIGLSSFIFSYLATGQEGLSYAGTLGAVTTAIIMLGQQPTVLFAAERFAEISIGILIATLVSQFILPIHARTHLRRSQATTLEQLRDYYTGTMIERSIDEQSADYHELDENIVKSLLKQRELAKESAHEPLGTTFDSAHFMKTLYCEREMLRAITFMHNALIHIKKYEQFLDQSAAMHLFNETLLQSINTLAKAIDADNTPLNDHIHIPSLNGIKEDIQKSVDIPSREDLIYIDGFLFSAEVLTNNLATLATLYRLPIYAAEQAT